MNAGVLGLGIPRSTMQAYCKWKIKGWHYMGLEFENKGWIQV